MDKKKLKEKLHQYIDNLEDEAALNMLHEAAAVEYEKAGTKEMEGELSPEQVERLKESLQQLNNGQWKSDEEVKKMARTWIKHPDKNTYP